MRRFRIINDWMQHILIELKIAPLGYVPFVFLDLSQHKNNDQTRITFTETSVGNYDPFIYEIMRPDKKIHE